MPPETLRVSSATSVSRIPIPDRIATHSIWNWNEVFTYFSHGASECNDYLLARMARQLRLPRHMLDDLLDCSLSSDAYVQFLKSNGHMKR